MSIPNDTAYYFDQEELKCHIKSKTWIRVMGIIKSLSTHHAMFPPPPHSHHLNLLRLRHRRPPHLPPAPPPPTYLSPPHQTGPRSAVGNVSGYRCVSDCRSRGREWIPARSHPFVEIDHEIISMVILLPSADSFKKGCCQLQAKVCAQITG